MVINDKTKQDDTQKIITALKQLEGIKRTLLEVVKKK